MSKFSRTIATVTAAAATVLLLASCVTPATPAVEPTPAGASTGLQTVLDRAGMFTTNAELAAQFGADAEAHTLNPALKATYYLLPLAHGKKPAVVKGSNPNAWVYNPKTAEELRAATVLFAACSLNGSPAPTVDPRFQFAGDGTPWVLPRHCEQGLQSATPGEFASFGASSTINPDAPVARALLAGLERLSLVEG